MLICILNFITEYWVSLIGAVIGLLYLYFEYKANTWMWVVGIVMSVFYIYIFYVNSLYASMGIYAYFLAASIYGLIMWLTKYKKSENGYFRISLIDKRYWPLLIVAVAGICAILYLILTVFGTYLPYITFGDALSTSLNFVALWMISRKYVEQWLLVIPANAISAILLFVQNDIISSCLFSIYFFVSISGYYKWGKMV